MAGPCICHSSCQNPLPAGKDKFASTAPIEGNNTPALTLVMSYATTLALAIALAAALSSDNKLFKQFMKAYLEA